MPLHTRRTERLTNGIVNSNRPASRRSDTLEEASVSAEVVSVASPEEGLTALNAREVTAYASDQVVLIGQVLTQKDNDENYFLTGDFFSYEPYALAIRRGDPDFALLADRTISRLFRSGDIQGIYEDSFGRFGLKPADALLTLYDLLATPE